MGGSHLVEIRLGGEIKNHLNEIIEDIADRFDARQLVRSHYVPHITLYGPFRTRKEKVALARIRDVCARYDLVPFRLEGLDHFKRETIYVDVHSSQPLRQLRLNLSRELRPISHAEESYDHDRWCKFHSTIARDVSYNFEDIWEYVSTEYDIHYEGYVERVNLVRNGNIVKEYSLPQGRFLSSDAATSKPAWVRDSELIERYRQPSDHDNLVPSQPGRVRKWRTLLLDRLSSDGDNRRNKGFDERPPRTFLSGDLHLNHGNIIEYCDRPFDSVYEMNQRLISNWNDAVGPDDTVVFLGDLALYYGTITTHDWLHALNGDIIFIEGNHDEAKSIDYEDSHILETNKRRYYCTHRPEDAPNDWSGWVIHGHKHNNDVVEFPFINFDEKRVNVAPELIGYTPLSVEALECIIESNSGVVPSLESAEVDLLDSLPDTHTHSL